MLENRVYGIGRLNMPQRKYTAIIVHRDIYCSSSHNYVGRVTIVSSRKRETRYYDVHNGTIEQHSNWSEKCYPAYVRNAVKRQYRDMLEQGELSVYECDRDGNRRYHDYRYHSDEYLISLIRGL